MFFMSRGRKGDKACLGAANSLDVLGLNYASSRYDEDVKKYPDRLMVGSETMVADLPYNWERVQKYPQLLGDFVWSAWDYLGEACIGRLDLPFLQRVAPACRTGNDRYYRKAPGVDVFHADRLGPAEKNRSLEYVL